MPPGGAGDQHDHPGGQAFDYTVNAAFLPVRAEGWRVPRESEAAPWPPPICATVPGPPKGRCVSRSTAGPARPRSGRSLARLAPGGWLCPTTAPPPHAPTWSTTTASDAARKKSLCVDGDVAALADTQGAPPAAAAWPDSSVSSPAFRVGWWTRRTCASATGPSSSRRGIREGSSSAASRRASRADGRPPHPRRGVRPGYRGHERPSPLPRSVISP